MNKFDKIYYSIKVFSAKFKKILGFSLIELMISLITISCIAAAFAPVITKRLSSQSSNVRSGTQVMSECDKFKLNPNDANSPSYCSLCYPNECVVCNLECAFNQALNVKKCRCMNCTNIGGTSRPNCETCKFTDDSVDNPQTCITCKTGYYNPPTCSACPSGKCCYDGVNAVDCVKEYDLVH